jgi:flagellar protein FliO/FliZ
LAAVAAACCVIICGGLAAQSVQAQASPAAQSILKADERSLSLGSPETGAEPKPIKSNGVGAWAFIQMFLVLALVVGTIYAVFTLIKKFNKTPSAQSSGLRVLASAGLGPGKAVHVVQAGQKAFLVGAADQSVSLIAEVTDKEYLDQLVLAAESGPPREKTDFSAILSTILNPQGRKKGSARTQGPSVGGFDFLGKQRDRLKKL